MQMNLDFTAAKARGDLGAERAASKAERVSPGWIDRAAEDIRAYAKSADGEFTIEQARAKCAPLPLTADARAWGQVTRRAVQLGIIEPTGGYAKTASSNGSVKALYRRGRLA